MANFIKKDYKMIFTEKTQFKYGKVDLYFLNKEEVLSFPHSFIITSHCFPILNDDVLFTINHRGIDIIGGHIEKDETPEQALIREAREEASIIPLNYEVIGGILVDNSNAPLAMENGYPEKGIELFYKVTQFEILDFNISHESTDRVFINKNNVREKHHKWRKAYQAVLDSCFENKYKLKM